jgi:hypothetical protein
MSGGPFLSKLIIIHINSKSDTYHDNKESAPWLLLSWSREEKDPSTNNQNHNVRPHITTTKKVIFFPRFSETAVEVREENKNFLY